VCEYIVTSYDGACGLNGMQCRAASVTDDVCDDSRRTVALLRARRHCRHYYFINLAQLLFEIKKNKLTFEIKEMMNFAKPSKQKFEIVDFIKSRKTNSGEKTDSLFISSKLD